MERVRTGGGPFVPQVDATDEKLLAVLGNRAVPLVNCFDSDASYHIIPAVGMLMVAYLIFIYFVNCFFLLNTITYVK